LTRQQRVDGIAAHQQRHRGEVLRLAREVGEAIGTDQIAPRGERDLVGPCRTALAPIRREFVDLRVLGEIIALMSRTSPETAGSQTWDQSVRPRLHAERRFAAAGSCPAGQVLFIVQVAGAAEDRDLLRLAMQGDVRVLNVPAMLEHCRSRS
jgi:hypothetical protein